MKKEVSVIIPIYNAEETLESILEELQNQSISNAEFILIDDGSTDDSITIIKEFIHRVQDYRFILLTKKNEGVSSARNLGIEKASGKYLVFVDADDHISNDFLENYLERIKSHDSDIEFFSLKKVNDEGRVIGKAKYNVPNGCKQISTVQFIEMVSNFKAWGYPPSYISKASLWGKERFDTSLFYEEDLKVLIDILVSYPQLNIWINSNSYYTYLIHKNSSTGNMGINGYWQAVKVTEYIYHKVNCLDNKTLKKKILGMKALVLLNVIRESILNNSEINYKKSRYEFLNVLPKGRMTFYMFMRKFIFFFLVYLDQKEILKFIYKKKYDIP